MNDLHGDEHLRDIQPPSRSDIDDAVDAIFDDREKLIDLILSNEFPQEEFLACLRMMHYSAQLAKSSTDSLLRMKHSYDMNSAGKQLITITQISARQRAEDNLEN